ncbi:hypothetical protein MY5147_001754 [Beauveria neobassiana]|uniref:Uncharacterized protein n=1 Tax=Beauveria bassiana D1-5 TaxID=1245745 RepID=A0A0A2VSD8_BEABA|nr:hypothetical protein BBAD15_g3832 [Beauveria bassiana D1-5]
MRWNICSNEDWSWEFAVRSPDSSIWTSTVLVKTPYGASNKRGEDDEVMTIEVIDEDMDMVMEHYVCYQLTISEALRA